MIKRYRLSTFAQAINVGFGRLDAAPDSWFYPRSPAEEAGLLAVGCQADDTALPGLENAIYFDINTGTLLSPNGFPIDVGGSVQQLTFNDTTKAAANTAAIQAAASIGGRVVINGAGRLYVLDTITGGQLPTSIALGVGVVYTTLPKTVNGPTYPAFQNNRINPKRFGISSITGVLAGTHALRMTVTTSAPHDMKAGGYIYILRDTNDVFNGFWPIESVTATSVVVLTGLANPTSGFTFPSYGGSPLCCQADADFQVTGPGTIDMNFLDGGFTESNSWKDHAIIVNNCLRPKVSEVRILDARKYCVCAQNVWHPRLIDLEGRTIADGVHIYGPFSDAVVDSISGEFGDDSVVFQTVDGTGYLQFMLPEDGRAYPGGNMYGTKAVNVTPRWSGNAGSVMMYASDGIDNVGGTVAGYTFPAGDLGYRTKGQHIGEGAKHGYQSVLGNYYSSSTYTVGGGYVLTSGTIEHLHLKNMQFGPFAFDNTGGGTISIKSLTIDNMTSDTFIGTNNARINFVKMNISNLIVNGGYIKAQSGTTAEFVLVGGGTTIRNLVFNGTFFEATAGSCAFVAGNGGTLGHVTFNSVYALGTVALVNDNPGSFANRVKLTVNGATADPGSAVALIGFGGTTVMDIVINGVHLISGRLLNLYGTGASSVMLNGLVDESGSGNAVLNWPASNAASFNNPDGSMPVDITKIKRAAGNIVKALSNTGVGGATDILASNLCVCDATNTTGSWKQLSAPTTRSY